MNESSPHITMLDGRQTGGRKGLAYDWQRLLLGIGYDGDALVTDEALRALLSASVADLGVHEIA